MKGVEGRGRAAGYDVRWMGREHGGAGGQQGAQPDGGQPGPVAVAGGPVQHLAEDPPGGMQGGTPVALLGQQNLAGVLVAAAAAVERGQLLIRLRAVSQG